MDLFSVTHQEILDRISRHCPDAMSCYLHCYNRSRSSQTSSIFFSKDEIETDLSESYTLFRNRLKKLAKENLLEWVLIDDGIGVTLADIDE